MKALKTIPRYAFCICMALVSIEVSAQEKGSETVSTSNNLCNAVFRLTDVERDTLEKKFNTIVSDLSDQYNLNLSSLQLTLVSTLMAAKEIGAYNVKLTLTNGKDYWPQNDLKVIFGEDGVIKVKGIRDYVNYNETPEFEIELSQITFINYSYRDDSGKLSTPYITNDGNNRNSPATPANRKTDLAQADNVSSYQADVDTQIIRLAEVFQSRFRLGAQAFDRLYDISLKNGPVKTAQIIKLSYINGRPAVHLVTPADGPMSRQFWDDRNYVELPVLMDDIVSIREP